jgi:hypothetical protein
MSQQINLINPALIKQKDFLTIVNMGVVYGVFTALMLGWWSYSQQQLKQLTRQKEDLVVAVQQTQDRLTQQVAASAPRAPSLALQQQLALLETKQQVQAQMLTAIEQGRPQQDRGLANYMRGFAQQTVDGLWLTGFSIDETNKTMTVRGRSLEAEVLPNYMQRLGQEPVFAGKLFGGLHVQQATITQPATMIAAVPSRAGVPNNTVSTAVAEQSKTASPAGVTNASTANVAVPNIAAPNTTTSEIATPFVEFELQGLEKASASRAENTASPEVKS